MILLKRYWGGAFEVFQVILMDDQLPIKFKLESRV